MIRLKKQPAPKPAIPLTPMIDCVFLLLIYFLVTATLEKEEADLSFQLPGKVELDAPLNLPAEQVVEIRAGGQAVLNDYPCDTPDAPRFRELAGLLARFKQSCGICRAEAAVTIAPANNTAHQHVVKVMDACASAGIEHVNFALAEENF